MSLAYPPMRPFACADVHAWTSEEAAAFDRASIDDLGVPQPVLMENAGRAAASVAQRLWPEGRALAVVGSGNNGGDALVAVRTLASWGRSVEVILVSDLPVDDPVLHGWGIPIRTDRDLGPEGWAEALRGVGVVFDGLLGTGARGAPRERQAAAIEALNTAAAPVLAIDVPSGVDGTTGVVAGVAVKAAVTVAFGRPKLGAFLHPARAFVGRHVAVEIGFPPLEDAPAAFVSTPRWARARRPRRTTDTHKNEVGRVAIVAGSPGMAGAAVLAARGAFRSGAGLVQVVSAEENRSAIQAALPEAIFVTATESAAVADALATADAVVVGPGLGTGTEAEALLAEAAGSGTVPMLLDADALNLVAAGFDLGGLVGSGRPVLMTPHPGEMARLLPDLSGDPVTRVRAAAEQLGCAVLLKGAPSVVAERAGRVVVDTQSSSDLAVAGMGDVLAGVCGGLMAQGLAPAEAGAVGLYLSGRAARIAGRGAALTPSDVVRWLPEALTEEGETETDLDLPFVFFDADPAR